METPALELLNVNKFYDNKKVLDRIDISIPQGSTHALIGSSGSGKTTLLRIILGLTSFDQGYVRINGQELLSFSSEDWSTRIGYVPQEGGLFPHLNARKNITLVAELRGCKPERIRQRLDELKAIVSLDTSLLESFPSQLSGGQRQRVALMRAAFMDPPVMLLDEPMGALDPLLRRTLQEELKSVFKRLKKTVLIVTHDLGEAAFLAEQMTLLHEGRVVQTGTYRDLALHPKDPFVSFFIQAQRTLPELENL